MCKPVARLLLLSPIALLAACNESDEVPGHIPTETPAPIGTTQIEEAAAPLAYTCDPGPNLTVRYDNTGSESLALLTIDGTPYELTLARSGSGARYVTENGLTAGKTLVWWTKGQDGTLFQGDVGGTEDSEVLLAECSPGAG